MLNRQDLARLLVTGLCSFSIACSADVAGSGDGFDPEALTPAQLAGPERPLGAADPYAQAAATWGVPQDLLVAIAMTETRMQSVVGEEEFPGMPAAFGVMALRGERLEEGARLAGLSVDDVRAQVGPNVMAAAALLASWADEAGLSADADLGAWAPVLARYSGIEGEEGEESRRGYVWDGVFAHLEAGVEAEGIAVKPRPIVSDYPRPVGPLSIAPAERSYATWRASPNFNSRGGYRPELIVIHSCEGAYSGCWGWLVNSAAGVSAHYVVNETGSDVSQLVFEADRAWHVGASYDCALNGNTLCNRSGVSTNTLAVGIEHAGYASQASWDAGLLSTSAQLTRDIANTHGIPKDSYHIVAHGRLQPYNRTDPGPNWPWTSYLADVQGGAPAPAPAPAPAGQFVVDSNNAANAAGRSVSVSASWWSSQGIAGYWNTGYWVGPTAAVSDPARFFFNETQRRCYTVEAWWTSDPSRASAATFIAYDAAGVEVGRTNVNQQINGGRWNTLGTWQFTAGDNQVALSRWTTSGTYVIADALRFTPSSNCTAPAPPPAPALFNVTVDDDVALNPSGTDVDVFGNWTVSNATSGYNGTGYKYAATTNNWNSMVKFWVFLDQPRTLTVDMRWTAGANRTDRALVGIFDANNVELARVRVNEQVNGGQWNSLGTYTLPAGWVWVGVGARATLGFVSIADAVRFRE
jgi:N-acetyl-anhydromuramyl-L-alanine amidase AmpD